jgi:DNA-binding YbaB/EbfC family protein
MAPARRRPPGTTPAVPDGQEHDERGRPVAMGRGGFNPNQMMKQIQKMQRDMEEAQAKLAEEVVEGTAGGGAVVARVKGDSTVESIQIDPAAIDPDDTEMLGDLITAAVNEALRNARELAADRLGGVTQGLSLPPGLF